MDVQVFALCDAATESGGKLNILGIFDSLHAVEAPVTHPQCAIALRIRFMRLERGDHKLRLNIVDVDGKSMIQPLDGQVTVNFPDQMSSAGVPLVLNLQRVRFPGFGEYSIDLAIDGRQVASIPLFVRQTTPPPGASPQSLQGPSRLA